MKKLLGMLTVTLLFTGAARAGSDTRLRGSNPVIAAGETHSLFIRPNGWLYAWGDNTWGGLGDDSVATKLNPVPVSLNGAVQVSAGVQYSLALLGNGQIFSWGRDDAGQLGNNVITTTRTAYKVPAVMGSANDWRFVTAGRAHAFAIKIDGTLWGWGDNGSGQLGLGTTAGTGPQKVPKRVGTFTDWVAISAGKSFSVGLRADGTIWSAGINDKGQLGTAGLPVEGVSAFQQIGGAASTDRWLAVAAGTNFALALKDNGEIWSWGANDQGQLGDGTKTAHTPPARASGGPYRAIAAGDKHSLGVRWDGKVYAAGYNVSGELGVGDQQQRSAFTFVKDYGQHLAAGKQFTIFLGADGYLNIAGLGSSGQIGAGSGHTLEPTAYPPWKDYEFDGWSMGVKPNSIFAGTNHSLAIRSEGSIEAWGDNGQGQVGPSATASVVTTPVIQGSIGGRWLQLAAGDYHTMAVNSDGRLYTWGGNALGELGIGTRDFVAHREPIEVLAGKKILKAAAHYETSMALTADGKLYGWGDNDTGQAGLGDTGQTQINAPRAAAMPTGSRFVAVGLDNKCGAAVRSDGTLWVWGFFAGVQTWTPKQMGTDKNWVTVAVGGANGILAVKADGRIYAAQSATAMTQIATGVRANLVAVTHAAALVSASGGRVFGWGDNSLGQQGNGQEFGTVPSSTPTATLFFNPRELSCGGFHSWEIVADGGGRQIAGDNNRGQLGLGYQGGDLSSPILIGPGYF